MFEHLGAHKHIVVTGPQRSGTRICAQMIATDTGFTYIDERKIDIDSMYRMFEALGIDNTVTHAPAMCRYAHLIGQVPDTVVVLVRREIADIIASQERIGWMWENVEKLYYADTGLDMNQPIAAIKYQYWEKQREAIPHYHEVDYRSLAEHPLWVPKNERKHF